MGKNTITLFCPHLGEQLTLVPLDSTPMSVCVCV